MTPSEGDQLVDVAVVAGVAPQAAAEVGDQDQIPGRGQGVIMARRPGTVGFVAITVADWW